jgi:hypothetical protein
MQQPQNSLTKCPSLSGISILTDNSLENNIATSDQTKPDESLAVSKAEINSNGIQDASSPFEFDDVPWATEPTETVSEMPVPSSGDGFSYIEPGRTWEEGPVGSFSFPLTHGQFQTMINAGKSRRNETPYYLIGGPQSGFMSGQGQSNDLSTSYRNGLRQNSDPLNQSAIEHKVVDLDWLEVAEPAQETRLASRLEMTSTPSAGWNENSIDATNAQNTWASFPSSVHLANGNSESTCQSAFNERAMCMPMQTYQLHRLRHRFYSSDGLPYTDALDTEPNIPKTQRNRPHWTCPASFHFGNIGLPYWSRDDFLVRQKKAGLTYKEIKAQGGFSEAESTLRGRYRNLTKRKEERVRKPEWQDRDVRLHLH